MSGSQNRSKLTAIVARIVSVFGHRTHKMPCFGPVAQRLEQGTHNPLVGGSNPSGPIF